MNLLVTLFSIAGLVWMLPVIQRGRVLVMAMVVLIVGTIFGPAFFAVEGPILFSLDRVLWFAMFGLAAIGWRLSYTRTPQLNRIDWLVMAIVVWFFLSAIRGGSVPTGSSPVARWLFYIVMPAGMYTIARLVDIRGKEVRWMLVGSIVLGMYLAITAMLEISGLHQFVFPTYIRNPENWLFLGRGRGPLMNPAGNGIVISIAVTAATLGAIFAGRREKLFFVALGLVLLGGIYATLTRSVWMGALLAMGIVILVYSPRWVRVIGLAAVFVIGGASVMGMKDQLVRMKREKNLSAADAEKSIQLRPLLAVVALEMFKDHPLIGHGFGHYFEHNSRYHNNRSYNLPLGEARRYAQHNVFLSVLVDTGLIGLSLFVAWLAMLAGIGWQLARQIPSRRESQWVGLLVLGILAAYACNGMFHDVMVIPMVHMFLFFLAGVAVTVYQRGLAVPATEPTHAAIPSTAPSLS
ncbi:MAG: O-antigen ligase family protein [Rubripirellula sp.]